MIRLAGENDLPLLRELAGRYPAASVRIETVLALYGTDERRVLYWIGDRGGGPDAAICLEDGSLFVAAEEVTDELCAFVRVLDFASLEGPISLCERLGSAEDIPARTVMTFSGETMPNELESPRPEEAYHLICEVMGWPELDPAWSGWYVQLSALLRNGRGALRGVCEDGRLVSTAGVYARDGRYALIGGVVTLPAYRGRGHAVRLIGGLCHEVVTAGRTPLLLCEEKLEAFYQGLGFRAVGQWGQLEVFASR